MHKLLKYSILIALTAVLYQCISIVLAASTLLICLIYFNITPIVIYLMGDKVLQDKPIHWDGCNSDHHKRRHATYPSPLANSWYHFVDSDELVGDKVMEVRALNSVFALWRDPKSGKPVCHEAFCPHLGANLAKGGKVNEDGKIVCPFHAWEFNSDGTIHNIPYLAKGGAAEDPKLKKECTLKRKLRMLPCVDFCGLVMVFYHEDREAKPTFPLPTYIEEELQGKYSSSGAGIDGTKDHITTWSQHLKFDIGFVTLTPTDWVDQAGDHAHFHTLHNEIVIPWTTCKIPDFLQKLFPISIQHKLTTYKGNDPAWNDKAEADFKNHYKFTLDKAYIFFTDIAGIAYNKQLMKTTESETLEMYIGPALMIFHIPFTLGAFKVFVSTTPCDGGSVMRVRTFCNSENFVVRAVAWILSGLSASQLASDIEILENKVRLNKPMIVPFDGPYNRVNAWMKQFYTEGSDKQVDRYALDW